MFIVSLDLAVKTSIFDTSRNASIPGVPNQKWSTTQQRFKLVPAAPRAPKRSPLLRIILLNTGELIETGCVHIVN